ncbi:DUF2971 domain-containing protein [Shewanella sp. ALD9]|uniref:DUF2971 domain-containing protein n=1 Tax=Shewanella sp. ALD9 TaxID=2058330 RepID=UPI000C32D0B8|nr:DUF2971 domain-containing protein [Shewanella sp. ALD9]PKH28468.1 hypothetical protein CXF88_20520 [Shewanella sp. ALD9]
MKLFHFLPEVWALEAINKQRLKISKYSDFNDPFELTAMSLGDRIDRRLINESKRKLDEKLRVLCCSASWNSPLLWGHYGDKHKGVALELEVPDKAAEAISYRKSREQVDLGDLFSQRDEESKRRFFKLCNTKYIEWGYEDEYRVQFTQEDFYSEGDHDFYDLGTEIKITGIVLGALNKTLTKSKVHDVLPQGHVISVTTTRTAFTSFNIVHRKDKPVYKVQGES